MSSQNDVPPSKPSEPRPPTPSAATNAVPEGLELRVTQQRLALTSKLTALKSEAKPETVVERDTIKARLSLLEHLEKGVVDGWANVGPDTREKLESWLAS